MNKFIFLIIPFLIGCAGSSVIMNDGTTVVIDWDPSLGDKSNAYKTAVKSCQAIGKKDAKEKTIVSANPNLPNFMTRRSISYKCI